MSARRDAARLVPPSVADARGRAFGETMAQALGEPSFRKLLFERIDDIGDEALPFLAREFSIHHLIEPGMRPEIVRRLIKGSYRLHARMGFIDAVRDGLAMMGVRVTDWEQWFQRAPPGPAGTHRVSIALDEALFEAEGRAITVRLQRAIARMVERVKRHSQDVALRFDVESGVNLFIGCAIVTRMSVRPSTTPITNLAAAAPVFVGAAVISRVRVKPETIP